MTRIPVDIEGVKRIGAAMWQPSFFWPVHDTEFLRMTADVERLLAETIQHAPTTLAEALLVKRNLFTEYVHLLHARMVIERLHAQTMEPFVAPTTMWYPALMRGDLASVTVSMSGKRSSVFPIADTRSLFRKMFSTTRRIVNDVVLNFSLGRGPRALVGRASGLIVGNASLLVRDHLRSLSYRCTTTRAIDWGSIPMHPIDISLCTSFAETMVAALARIADAYGASFDAAQYAYLHRFTADQLGDAVRAIAFIRTRVGAQPPSILAAPVFGAPFERALAVALRPLGTRVVSYAHGGSIGLFDVPTLALSEFALADAFVAMTRGSVGLFSRILAHHPPLQGNRPQIISADCNVYARRWQVSRHMPLPPQVRRVMIVGFPHAPWRRSHSSASFSLFHLDLELRIARRLRDAGFFVIYKAHPDRAQEVRGFFEPFGEVLVEDIATSHLRADAFFFGTMRTSAFPIALCTKKPIVALQMVPDVAPPFPDAFALLKKRCTVLDARLDPRGRILFDEEMLVTAFAETPREPNHDFVSTYLFPSDPL